jgi:hypothetical protein
VDGVGVADEQLRGTGAMKYARRAEFLVDSRNYANGDILLFRHRKKENVP